MLLSWAGAQLKLDADEPTKAVDSANDVDDEFDATARASPLRRTAFGTDGVERTIKEAIEENNVKQDEID